MSLFCMIFYSWPISCPGTLTHCLLDFWKIVLFKKRTEPPGKKTGSTEEDLAIPKKIQAQVRPDDQSGYPHNS